MSGIRMFFAFLLAVAAVAAFGGLFEPGDWFDSIAKPAWNPPGAVFGPVWFVLYVMIAVAGWIVWRERGFRGAALPLGLYAVQLLLNGLWSWIFFGLHRPGLAFLEISVLWVAILGTLIAFFRIRATAGWLLVPYLAWVTFAAALNFTIWRLNP
jgi:tryptophan-rich sensory protein